MDGALYGVDELADLGGVTRRTVRYYIQEGLLPAPLGVGRGRHYGPEHLERLLRIKAMQERGLALSEVREALRGAGVVTVVPVPVTAVARSAWTRLELRPGVELLVSSEWRIPPPGRVLELAEWCQRHFRRQGEASDE